MAKPKELGYVELEWTCPTCGRRNAGRDAVCPTCGAPQPANAAFEAPEHAALIKPDDAQAAQVAQVVSAGPDVQCPFCGARNPATATECKQCHAPLQGAAKREQGENLGTVQTGPLPDVICHVCGAANPGAAKQCSRCGAPLVRRAAVTKPGAPAPLPKPQHGGVAIWWLVGAGLLVVLLFGIFAWLGLRTETQTAVAEKARWERSVTVLGLVPVEQRAWQDQLPANVDVLDCHDELYAISPDPQPGAREVCGTPYTVDTGTGYGKVLQDCEYQVFAPMCSYQTLQWLPVDTLVQSGEGFSPLWQSLAAAPDRQEGKRSERYVCDVRAGDQLYSFELSANAYAQCRPQSQWRIDVNGLGAVVDAAPLAAQ